ncbi:MAG: hypothetical protein ABSC31_05330 [Acidimicrobiales bacterium]
MDFAPSWAQPPLVLAVEADHHPNADFSVGRGEVGDSESVAGRERRLHREVTSVDFRVRRHGLASAVDEGGGIARGAAPALQIRDHDCHVELDGNPAEVAQPVTVGLDRPVGPGTAAVGIIGAGV